MIYRGILSLKRGLDQARHMLSDRLRAIGQVWVRHTAAFRATRLTKVLAAASLTVIVTAALFALGPFGTHSRPTSLLVQLQPSQKFQDGALAIIVASTIYAEASEPWPVVVEIDPPQGVPPDSVLHVRGLPPTTTLSEGHRVSAGVWAVPLVGLSNLEIHVAAGVSERSDLTLTLIRTDGSILAKASTVLLILEPIGTTTTVAAVKDTSAGNPDRGGRETGPPDGVRETLPAATSQPIEPAPSRTPSTVADRPKPLPVTEPDSSGQQSTPKPVREIKTASSIIPEPLRARETPASPQPSSAIAPIKLDNSSEVLPVLAGPSRSASKVTNDQDQGAAPEAPARSALRETKTASTTTRGPSPATATSIAPEPPLAAAKTITQEERSRAEKMIVRGERDLENGNVSGARQFFLRAAEAGLAQGAFLLASTYDTHEFARLRFVGVQPNLAIARKWYNHARELGARQAQDRLARLGVAD